MEAGVKPRRYAAVLVACFVIAAGDPLDAATSTSTMTVQMTITATCTVNSASALNFGTQGILSTNVDQTSTIQVTCTNTTPYNIGLDAGTGSGATVAVRKLTSGGATVNYSLYSDTGRTTVWGTTIGTDTVAATGSGAAQNYTVYGRIPAGQNVNAVSSRSRPRASQARTWAMRA